MGLAATQDAGAKTRSAPGGDQPLLRHCDVSLSDKDRKPQYSPQSNARPRCIALHNPRPPLGVQTVTVYNFRCRLSVAGRPQFGLKCDERCHYVPFQRTRGRTSTGLVYLLVVGAISAQERPPLDTQPLCAPSD